MIRAELPFSRLAVQTLALATPAASIALAQRVASTFSECLRRATLTRHSDFD